MKIITSSEIQAEIIKKLSPLSTGGALNLLASLIGSLALTLEEKNLQDIEKTLDYFMQKVRLGIKKAKYFKNQKERK